MTDEEDRARRRADIIRARAERAALYTESVALRDQLARRAAQPDAIGFDRQEAGDAEERVKSALRRMEVFGDPLPQEQSANKGMASAPATGESAFTAAPPITRPAPAVVKPAASSWEATAQATLARIVASASAPLAAPAVDPVEAVAARILASDDAPADAPSADREVDQVAARIAASAASNAEDDDVDALARRIAQS